MNLLAFLRRRVVQMIPVLLGISLITFFMIHLIPGDPARNMLGPRATPERVAELRQSLGLDEPLWFQIPPVSDRCRARRPRALALLPPSRWSARSGAATADRLSDRLQRGHRVDRCDSARDRRGG